MKGEYNFAYFQGCLFSSSHFFLTSACASTAKIHLTEADGSGTVYVNSNESFNASSSNLTSYIGDLNVNGNQTLLMHDCEFNITGQIRISDQAQVIISNCTFISNWNMNDTPDKIGSLYWRTRHIIVNDEARLNISNSTVTLLAPREFAQMQIFAHVNAAYDDSLVTMVNSTLSWNGDELESVDSGISVNDAAKLVLINSVISTFQSPKDPEDFDFSPIKNFVKTDNTSTFIASNSTIDETNIDDTFHGGNSTVQMVNCKGDFVQVLGGTSQVSVTGTKMIWVYNIWGGSPRIFLNNCNITEVDDGDRTQKTFVSIANSTIGTLYAYGEVHLDNSSVTTFSRGPCTGTLCRVASATLRRCSCPILLGSIHTSHNHHNNRRPGLNHLACTLHQTTTQQTTRRQRPGKNSVASQQY